MDFKRLAPQIAQLRRRTPKEVGRIGAHNAIRDSFTITTWLALGALLQGMLLLLVRPVFALTPTVLLLSYRSLLTMLAHWGFIRNPQMDGVIMGKYSIQIPDRDGNPPKEPAEQSVAVIMLGARTNHALGIFGTGTKELGGYMVKMLKELAEDRENNGFLGANSWTASNERETNNELMTCCYFRSIEDIHRFAHGPLHREAWNWWNSITAQHPHLSIMHEVYHTPKKHWENVYVNFHLTGIGKIHAPVMIDGEEFKPVADASRGPLSTQQGRMGRSLEKSVHEKQ